MRAWQRLWESLKRAPLGHNADGRTIGVGLAAAQDRPRREVAEDVARYLRDTSPERPDAIPQDQR